MKLGHFDPHESNPWSHVPSSVIGSAEHMALAREAAAKSIVLLKNDPVEAGSKGGKNGGRLLPLNLDSLSRVGEGWGWGQGGGCRAPVALGTSCCQGSCAAPHRLPKWPLWQELYNNGLGSCAEPAFPAPAAPAAADHCGGAAGNLF